MVPFIVALTVLVGIVSAYAAGYFHERKIPGPIEKDPALPDEPNPSLQAVLEAYGEEVRLNYLRNHARRRADKFLREFVLASFHFTIFTVLLIACAKIANLADLTLVSEVLVGGALLTLGLKAGQLSAAKETAEAKEELLVHQTEVINEARRNMMRLCPKEFWIEAHMARDRQRIEGH